VRVQSQSVVYWSITQSRDLIHSSVGAIKAGLSAHDELPESMQLLAKRDGILSPTLSHVQVTLLRRYCLKA